MIQNILSASGQTREYVIDGETHTLTGGSRSWRNNNPGNIEYGNFAKSKGAIGSDGRFAIFPTYEAGRSAKEELIFESSGYKNKTLQSAISRYAPAFENNTGAYYKNVLSAAGGEKQMSEYTETERQNILNAMEKVEGYKPGKVDGEQSSLDWLRGKVGDTLKGVGNVLPSGVGGVFKQVLGGVGTVIDNDNTVDNSMLPNTENGIFSDYWKAGVIIIGSIALIVAGGYINGASGGLTKVLKG